MAVPTHDQREQAVLNDLLVSFPDFAGRPLLWTKVPDGDDPPDFMSVTNERIGLEMVEWLDGGQMGPAKARQARRLDMLRVLRDNWRTEYAPRSFRGAFIDVGDKRIVTADEAGLRKEFFEFAAAIDRSWETNPERIGIALNVQDFTGYPFIQKYVGSIRYIGGQPHGFCWIDMQGDGGAYDPGAAAQTLEVALDKKLTDYSGADRQSHLAAHSLTELYLLVHGGFNAYAYNSPSAPLSLATIAQRGAVFYATHPQRRVFDRVWFFDSLDSADDLNKLFGYPAGYGRVRFLAELWPNFLVYPETN
jgi:hypothetical protein